MKLNKDTILKVADLARINIEEKDIPRYVKDLSNILTLIEQMNEVNTDDVATMSHPYDTAQPLRDDVVTEDNRRDQMQNIAPKVKAGLYLVPKVIA